MYKHTYIFMHKVDFLSKNDKFSEALRACFERELEIDPT